MLIYYALNVTHKCNYNVTQKSRSDRVKARVRISAFRYSNTAAR